MFDLPLHPIVVHFPIVLGMVLPFLAIFVIFSVKREWFSARLWALVVIVSLAYGGTALVANELGEEDEDIVEKVVGHDLIHEHEEAGEKIPVIAGILFLVSLIGFMPKYAKHAQLAFVFLSLVAIQPLANTGHTGGKLVYQYGAANAHLPQKYRALVESGEFYKAVSKGDDHDDHDDDER